MDGLNQHKKGIGRRIKSLRGRFPQATFAALLKISVPSLQRYEYGERIPPGRVLDRLAKISGYRVEWILTGSKEALCGDEQDLPYIFDDESLKILEKMKGMNKVQKRETLRFIDGQKLLSECEKKPKKKKTAKKRR